MIIEMVCAEAGGVRVESPEFFVIRKCSKITLTKQQQIFREKSLPTQP